MAPWTFPSTTQTGARPDAEHTRNAITAVVGFAVVAIVPYVLVRKQFTKLHTQLEQLRTANAALAREMRFAMYPPRKHRSDAAEQVLAMLKERADVFERPSAVAAGTDATEKLQTAMKDVERNVLAETKQMGTLLDAIKSQTGELQWRQDTTLRKLNIALDLKKEDESPRLGFGQRYVNEMRALGRSLADLAAFVEEVEMREGWTPSPSDGRSIERMRRLGKRLEDIAAEVLQEEKGKEEKEKEQVDPATGESSSAHSF